jgi:hypothetical protein
MRAVKGLRRGRYNLIVGMIRIVSVGQILAIALLLPASSMSDEAADHPLG